MIAEEEKTMEETFDAIIIGFGKAGKTLAGALSKKGQKVALIEEDPLMYGGTCINVGCIPSKRLVLEAAEAPRDDYEAAKEHYRKAIAGKDELTGKLRGKNKDKLLLSGAELINGTASFLSDHLIQVEHEGKKRRLTAEKIFINTGSTSFLPDIKGLKDSQGVYTSNGLLNLTELPRRLLILGGGYIGLEFASMYANFGSQVEVIIDSPAFLKNEDDDIASAIKDNLEKQGIVFHFSTKTLEVSNKEKQVVLHYQQGESQGDFVGDALLVATGRLPNISALQLNNTHIKLNPRGAIAVDEHLQTSVPGVYALGDVNGGPQHTYVSLDDSRIILSALYGDGSYTLKERANVPYSVFLDTPLGRVGLTEKQAKEKGEDVIVSTLPVASIPKAQVYKKPQGLFKAVIRKSDHAILGVSLLGAEAFEIINIVKLAMDNGLKAEALAKMVYTHPTMAEAFNDLFAV